MLELEVEGNYSLQDLGRESELQKHQEKTLMNFITKEEKYIKEVHVQVLLSAFKVLIELI